MREEEGKVRVTKGKLRGVRLGEESRRVRRWVPDERRREEGREETFFGRISQSESNGGNG